MTLNGKYCSCSLCENAIQIKGQYFRYDLHKRHRTSEILSIDIMDVMRVGITKTYSRLMFLFPMTFGFLALIIKAIPAVEIRCEIIPDVYSLGHTFWSIPFQDEAWTFCAALCLLTVPLYWLSYRKDLEINTTKGRYLLPRKGMTNKDILDFQKNLLYFRASTKAQHK